MRWTLRARLLRLMASTPGGLSVYQTLQQYFGLHRRESFILGCLDCGFSIAEAMVRQGVRLRGAKLVEVGTGWVPVVPVSLWVMGASRIETFDVHPWVLPRVLHESLATMIAHREELSLRWSRIANADLVSRRFDVLADVAGRPLELLERARIQLRAPADATRTGLDAASVDGHYSLHVLEHVEPSILTHLLNEASRVLRPGAPSVHLVDPSDHFAHFDPSISRVNFLQFDEETWGRISGNRLTYHNRLRVAEHVGLLEESPLELTESMSRIDPRALKAIENGLPLASRFRDFPPEELARERLLATLRKP